VRDFLNLEWIGNSSSFMQYLVVEYIPGIWLALINALNLLIVDHLSSFRQHTQIISYQKFIFLVHSCYMMLNMLVLPLIGYGSDSSWSLIEGFITWRKVRSQFIFGTISTFYLTLLLQQASLGFQYVLLRMTDLLNFLCRVGAINKFYISISQKPWLKFECDTFDYGYYYAMYTTFIIIVCAFG
jgi:hypothetical protein